MAEQPGGSDVTALPDLSHGPPRASSVASALLRHGPEYAGVLLHGLPDWVSCKGFEDLSEVRGLLVAPDAEGSEAEERADCVWALRKTNSGIYDTY